MAKIKTVGTISDFMAGKHNETWVDRAKERMTQERIEKWMKKATGLTVPVMLGSSVASHAFAAPAAVAASAPVVAAGISTATTNLILHAFDPLIQMLVAISFPVAGVMISGGCLMILVGLKEKGYSILTNAAIGYILVQLSPLLLKLLVGIGTGVVM